MTRFRELLSVAGSGLTARKIRTFLIMLGPVVGVAAMVGAVGLTESAKGDLKAKLSALGTSLITVQAGGTFGQQNPTLPTDSVHRVQAVPTVRRASAVAEVDGVLTLPNAGSEKFYEAFPVPVLAADDALPQVLEVPMQSGRWLVAGDGHNHARAVVMGAGLASEYGVIPGEIRSLRLNGEDYGVVGVLDRVALDPNLDNAVFVPEWAAKHDFGTKGEPTKLYVRAREGETRGDVRGATDGDQPRQHRVGVDQDPERRARRRPRRPTRRCSRRRCSQASSRSRSAASVSPTSCRSR